MLYGIVLAFRFLVFGLGDPDNFLDLVVVFGVFFLVWLAAWAGTRAVLRHRRAPRGRRPDACGHGECSTQDHPGRPMAGLLA